MPSPKILVVDDDRIILDSLTEFLKLEGYDTGGARDYKSTLQALEREPYQLVITDINMPDADGFELLRVIKERYPDIVVVMITGYGTIESAVEAIKMGAYDYLTKPIIDDEILLVVERALKQQSLLRENQALRKQLEKRFGLGNIVGQDYKMLKVFDLVEAVADTRTNVLILGDSGTGKSLVARAIHHRSQRAGAPFVEVSCGAIPETLLESELFGHIKGAFTGAISDKTGRFKAADGGTIFLDEINSASPAFQFKLLRVLQERQFEPVGSDTTETVDVRIILASNADLLTEVKAGRFREDLYYRIHVVTIELPGLAERISDIPLLAEHFLDKYRAEQRKELLGFTDEAKRYLQQYPWPGNVRELENVIERAVVLTRNRHIAAEDLPETMLSVARYAVSDEEYKPMCLRRALEEPERQIIEAALRANRWNRQITADLLEINRTTLYKKMKRYNLEADPAKIAQGA